MVLPKTNCLRQWRACFDLHQPQAWGLPSRLCLDGDCVRRLTEFIGELGVEERTDPGLLREAIRVEVRRFFRKRTGRRPLVLPIVMET